MFSPSKSPWSIKSPVCSPMVAIPFSLDDEYSVLSQSPLKTHNKGAGRAKPGNLGRGFNIHSTLSRCSSKKNLFSQFMSPIDTHGSSNSPQRGHKALPLQRLREKLRGGGGAAGAQAGGGSEGSRGRFGGFFSPMGLRAGRGNQGSSQSQSQSQSQEVLSAAASDPPSLQLGGEGGGGVDECVATLSTTGAGEN